MTLDKLLTHFDHKFTTRTGTHMCHCPSHKDSSPSLGISQGKNKNSIIINCLAGCAPLDVLQAVGLNMGDLFEDDDPVPAPKDWKERKEAMEQNHTIRRALDLIEITMAWVEQGNALTLEEARRARNAQLYLTERGML